MRIEGYVTDKNKSPIANALVEVKGENFVTLLLLLQLLKKVEFIRLLKYRMVLVV